MKSIPSLSWSDIYAQLNQQGYAHISEYLTSDECTQLYSQYASTELYRSTINMERYRFGKGEYKYFNYPLWPQVAKMRVEWYSPLSTIANQWMEWLGMPIRYPEAHDDFIRQCHEAGQNRPTPLILKYEASGYNTLHQDLYGEVYFPFQVVIPLTERGRDHHGGELVFIEQLPRAQSRAIVLTPGQGDAVIFTTNFRPVKGSRGWYRARMKHGVSSVTSGTRYACGIIFHDAA